MVVRELEQKKKTLALGEGLEVRRGARALAQTVTLPPVVETEQQPCGRTTWAIITAGQ
jgi:hypothetical protein